MGRMKIVDKHEMTREDVLAAVGAMKTVAESVPAIVKTVPWAVVLWWTFAKLREPIASVSIDGARAEIAFRLMTSTTPYYVLLGGIYQGLQGVAVALGGGAVQALVATMSIKEIVVPGKPPYWELSVMDALYLASMLPLILLTTSGQSVDTSRGVLEG